MKGYLEITFGPMFSGKTTNLINRIGKYLDIHEIKKNKKKGLVINSSKDNREEEVSNCNNLTTHSTTTKKLRDDIIFLKVEKLEDVDYKIINQVDYIAIDESQFFEDLERMVKEWLNLDKHIHCSGLISDVNRNPFGNLHKLFFIADDVEQLKAYCIKCSSFSMNAAFTKRLKEESSSTSFLTGGKNIYIPVCGLHY